MRATGIVRKIDNLGRVVIPKEIRRTFFIRENEKLEIFTGDDGEVTFKKYSPIRELGDFAVQYAESLYKAGGYPVIVCDRDKVISVAGVPKKQFLERRVSDDLEDCMMQRTSFVMSKDKRIRPVEGMDFYAIAGTSIIVADDIYGAIMFVSDKDLAVTGEADIKLISVAASFLGKLMEN